LPGNKIKLAAAWLIEQCGWKGFREGEAGVHEHQALVLVNFNNASGSDILMLAEKIEKSVEEKIWCTAGKRSEYCIASFRCFLLYKKYSDVAL